jgi:sortase A
MRVAGSVLVSAGALLLLEVALTLTWQEPLTGVVAALERPRLERELREQAHRARRAREELDGEGDRSGLAILAARLADQTEEGEAIGRIALPTIGRRYPFVEGADEASLQTGPGHYADTPLPGQRGTVGIAGHRTTYGAPFRRIDRLRPGDPIVVVMPYATFAYRVERTRAVFPKEVWVKRRVSYDRLIVSASHPPYSARQRLVVFARLVRAVRGAEGRPPERAASR